MAPVTLQATAVLSPRQGVLPNKTQARWMSPSWRYLDERVDLSGVGGIGALRRQDNQCGQRQLQHRPAFTYHCGRLRGCSTEMRGSTPLPACRTPSLWRRRPSRRVCASGQRLSQLRQNFRSNSRHSRARDNSTGTAPTARHNPARRRAVANPPTRSVPVASARGRIRQGWCGAPRAAIRGT
jgi:hypothetical protein